MRRKQPLVMQGLWAERDESNAKRYSLGAFPASTNGGLSFTEVVWLIFILFALLVVVHLGTGSAPDVAKSAPPAVEAVPVQRTGELETRAALERIFGKPFVKVRPPWIVNPRTNHRLELDCFNEELRLAVEYNGIQHSTFPNPFHRTLAEFEAQQWRDSYKAQACQRHGVCLLVVPCSIVRPEIEGYLRRELREQGFVI